MALPDRPSLAVLPFTSIGGNPEQDYFADGIVEEMITALSRMRSLFVIARNSSFTFKGRSIDVREIGRELGVRYVLEGSVRKAAGRLRITAQLVDAATGTNLWADRSQGALDDVFELQDQVTTSVVAAVSPSSSGRKSPAPNARRPKIWMRTTSTCAGWPATTSGPGSSSTRPCAAAYAMAAMAYAMRKSRGWVVDREKEVAETRRLARQAVEIGRDDAVALGFSGYALAHAARELEHGAALIDCALQLNPNLGSVLLASGWVRSGSASPRPPIPASGPGDAVEPLDPHMYMMQAATAHAHFFAGRFGESAAWAQKALREQVEGLPIVRIAAASLALSGRAGEARTAAERLLQLDPALRVSNFHETLGPYRHQEHVTQYRDALRKAGLPE